jgi:hypothetical protein
MTKARLVVIAAVGVAMGALQGDAWAGFCPYWGCGTNSATVGDGIVFDELSTTLGQPDEAGIYISKVTLKHPFKNPGKLMVDRDHLSAEDADGTIVQGDDLAGTVITVKHLDGRTYDLRISKVTDPCKITGSHNDCLRFWSSPNELTDLPTNTVPYYTFHVKKTKQRDSQPGNGPNDGPLDNDFNKSLCKTPQPVLMRLIRAGQWIENAKESAVVFTGDHYDSVTKQVQHGTEGWFNLGCADTVPAKLHLLRHTKAGSISSGSNQRTTSLGERTAMLRMLIADYCGNGSSFTFDGVPLNYGDVNGWYPDEIITTQQPDPRNRSFEAVWDSKGPMCLTEPRKACLGDIEKACRKSLDDPNWKLPPVCPNDGNNPGGGNPHALSANPSDTTAPNCPPSTNLQRRKPLGPPVPMKVSVRKQKSK